MLWKVQFYENDYSCFQMTFFFFLTIFVHLIVCVQVRLEKVSHKWSDGIRWKSNHKSDFKADSEQMMKKISVATDQIETKKPKTKVDHRVGLTVGV